MMLWWLVGWLVDMLGLRGGVFKGGGSIMG